MSLKSKIPEPLVGTLSIVAFVANTVFWIIPFYAVALLKLVPLAPVRRRCGLVLNWLAESWIGCNSRMLDAVHPIDWDVAGLDELTRRQWYLVVSNHQSWVDIVVLQYWLTGRIPLLKFFLKQKLIWVPLLGLAWWALDFPFMKRYSEHYLRKHPEKRGEDIEATRRACERFRTDPVSVMNFVEGTRFSTEKRDRQQAPFSHLLMPKSGGLAYALEAMGEQFHSMLDVTIAYHDPHYGFWDLMCGRVRRVSVRIQERPIPRELLEGDYPNDEAFRNRFRAWLTALWDDKDELLDELKAPVPPH